MREIEKKTSQLTAEEHEMLAERLLAAISGVPLTDAEEMWITEAEKRYSAWKAGRNQAIAAEQALADIRKELPW